MNPSEKIKLSILGSTGSIGTQALEVVAAHPHKFELIGISAGKNITLLEQQIQKFRPKHVSVQAESDIDLLQARNPNTHFYFGTQGLNQIATLPEHTLLLVALSGTHALLPTYLAIQKGCNIALACKEVLVSAGDLIMAEAKKKDVQIIPVDSEHASIAQCLAGCSEPSDIEAITLTASGGPFRETPKEEFHSITPEMALKHPNWTMGAKITIDSATLMNKGLEVIEAKHLFQLPLTKIKVLVHPQSIVHSLVEFCDGNIVSHMGIPDMRLPIQYALSYPEKWNSPWPKTHLSHQKALTFSEPDLEKFPLLQLAYDASEQGGALPAILNAANETHVHLFLKKKISFDDIFKLNQATVLKYAHVAIDTITDIVALDKEVKDSCHYEFTA